MPCMADIGQKKVLSVRSSWYIWCWKIEAGLSGLKRGGSLQNSADEGTGKGCFQV